MHTLWKSYQECLQYSILSFCLFACSLLVALTVPWTACFIDCLHAKVSFQSRIVLNEIVEIFMCKLMYQSYNMYHVLIVRIEFGCYCKYQYSHLVWKEKSEKGNCYFLFQGHCTTDRKDRSIQCMSIYNWSVNKLGGELL